MNPYLTGFRCLICGETWTPTEVTYTCPKDGGNVDAVYDYERMRRELDPHAIANDRDRSIWHYAPLLPLSPSPLRERLRDPFEGSVGVRVSPNTPLASLGWSPLYRAPVLEREIDVRAIWLKDDSRLPSSSFKDRASAMVIARAMEMGVKTICVASTGNAAAALSALCAGTDLRAVIFVPESTPEGKLAGILIHGATVFTVRGSYNDAVDMANAACQKFGWYNRSTGVNPFTREGKKTAGYEIAEQLSLTPYPAPRWPLRGPLTGRFASSHRDVPPAGRGEFRAPDIVIVPVGDGNIISGVHKGFYDLHQLGWIERMPRFIGVTASLAPSLYHAWRDGVETFVNVSSQTLASGISVDVPCDGVAALRAVRNTGGAFIEATDDEMLDAMRVLAERGGVFVEPACAAAHVGLWKARQQGIIGRNDEVVLQLTGSGLKDTRSALKAVHQPTRVESLDDVRL